MTLHQAAQKAVEALPRFRWDQDMDVLAGPYPDGEWVRRADVIAALQQQPAPVGHVVVDMQSNGPGDRIKWTKLALEHGTPLYASPPAIQPPAQSAIDKVRDLRDVQGQQGIGTDNYMRGLYNGLELALCTLEEREPDYAEKAALQHQEVPCGNTPYDEGPFTIATDGGQEVPREPVAVARPLTSEEEENAWNSITEQGCSCCTAAVRLFCRLNGITLSDAVLAASPSTTRQQEAIDRFNEQQIALHQQITATQQPSVAAHALNTTPVVDHATRQQEVGSVPSGETEAQRKEVCRAWADLPDALRCHPGLKRLYRALGGVHLDDPAAAPSTPENADGGPHG